ncbi:MAG: hypothetical protein ACFFD7_08240 [Candidatus Thorarchaeota archaeon]
MDSYKNELNERISNPYENINSVKGLEIITESLVYKVYDVFGRNSLLSILYQTGVFPGTIIAERIKKEYDKEEFEIVEALVILMDELKEYYSIQIRDIEQLDDRYRFVIENHCFLRSPIKNREKLKFGKALCRVNKGYFETAFQKLLGNKIKKIEINFLENDEEKDVCVEELNFYI